MISSSARRGQFDVRHTISVALVILMLTILPSGAWAGNDAAQKYPPTIVFMTDFGVLDDSVAICRGVMYGIMPDVRIVDLTHQVTPFSVFDGARYLFGATPYYPRGTVFVVVVDPGVGSSRKAIVAHSKKGQYFVLPDNGVITLVDQRDGIDAVREITNTEWMIGSKLSSTFRGDDWSKVGPEVPVRNLVRLDLRVATIDDHGLKASVIATDGPFGNLVTNVDGGDFLKLGYTHGQEVPVKVGDKELKMKFVKTFSDVPVGDPLLYVDSRGHLGLALNQRSFAETYGIRPPAALVIPRAGR